MIRYRLACPDRHDFEGWFRSYDDCTDQIESGILTCPVCGSDRIERALMAPAVAKSSALAQQGEAERHAPPDQAMLASNPKLAEIAAAFRELREKVVAHADDVGERFPEEARRIHYGEAEARGIYGQASAEEASSLLEEGIAVMPLPRLPEDHN
ncbi:DUF1178 family protein [Amorphus orientalis]|uniref:DUF1178 domain-containing protein n=1 Tax=Amorphus orientalis TaxID=649198 RepID=A0AAE4AUE5_9HYPH|nr:DUF1178 family protein [Amorphus orientalis]MDQ0317052.1 hypothetical protein [Amorphus orientalis]